MEEAPRILFVFCAVLSLLSCTSSSVAAFEIGYLQMQIYNCLPFPLTFVGCKDIIGTWMTQPTPHVSTQYTAVNAVIAPPSEFEPTMGNCTWNYGPNQSQQYPFFMDWTWSPLGNSFFAGGGNGQLGALVALGNSEDLESALWPLNCLWTFQGQGGWEDCYYQFLKQNYTRCQPLQLNNKMGAQASLKQGIKKV